MLAVLVGWEVGRLAIRASVYWIFPFMTLEFVRKIKIPCDMLQLYVLMAIIYHASAESIQ